MIADTHPERDQLRQHLASRHAALTPADTALGDLVDIHEHEHDGPATIRNHPRDDLSFDRDVAAANLAEGDLDADTARTVNHSGTHTLCDSCYPGVETAGALGDAATVARVDGRWSVIAGDGHLGDIIATFDTAPEPDPLGDGLLEWIDLYGSPTDPRLGGPDWTETGLAAADAAFVPMRPSDAWRTVENFRHAGWDQERDGWFETWFVDRCARLIDAYEHRHDDDTATTITVAVAGSAVLAGIDLFGTQAGVMRSVPNTNRAAIAAHFVAHATAVGDAVTVDRASIDADTAWVLHEAADAVERTDADVAGAIRTVAGRIDANPAVPDWVETTGGRPARIPSGWRGEH